VLEARELMHVLSDRHGPQQWWPAESPFEVMVGAMLVQRTSWTTAARAIERLRTKRLLDAARLRRMRPAALAELIKPAGFYRQKAPRLIALADFVYRAGGTARLASHDTEALRFRLLDVPGVGEETADAILLYAFERPVVVDDAYARRIIGRIGGTHPNRDSVRAFASLLVEHGDVLALNELHALIVVHAKDVCRATPVCQRCPLEARCNYAALSESEHRRGKRRPSRSSRAAGNAG
jgi:endonuclease-3 related protein